jgi:acetyl-CoA synthetase
MLAFNQAPISMTLIRRGANYEEICRNFHWQIPERYNIAGDVCDRWADDPTRVALIYEDARRAVRRYTFQDIRREANRLANALLTIGVTRGDRVMLLLGQVPECAIAHVACWKAGLVSVPTSVLFGPDAISYRLNDGGAVALITDHANYPKVAEVRAQCAGLRDVIVTDSAPHGARSLQQFLDNASPEFRNVDTAADDIAWISYTSGTTGSPKGAVHPHRVMLGHMPSLEFLFDFFPQANDVLWSPADWAWMAGMMDILMPGWFHGCPVVATAMKGFDAEYAYEVLDRHNVTLSLLTPTALKLMRQVPDAGRRYKVKLRVCVSGGESVGTELIDWAQRELGLQINEGYGQTECNVILGNNGNVMPIKPGSLGRPTPGTTCAIVDAHGREVPPGTVGQIACLRPHPVMFREYLNKPEATRDKFIGDWLLTGDLGHMDVDGYYWFHGRTDDLIKSSGYRIGPTEIEDALMRHPSVKMAAVIGVPDAVRHEVIKAFIIPAAGAVPSEALAEELRESVKNRLAKHEVPRFIEFVDTLPMTTTGKIMRRELREMEKTKRNAG